MFGQHRWIIGEVIEQAAQPELIGADIFFLAGHMANNIIGVDAVPSQE